MRDSFKESVLLHVPLGLPLSLASPRHDGERGLLCLAVTFTEIRALRFLPPRLRALWWQTGR